MVQRKRDVGGDKENQPGSSKAQEKKNISLTTM